MESEYIKERRLAWFAFKDLHKGEKGLSVQSFCAGYDAAQHRVHPTAFGVCPHGVNLGNQVCSACEPEKFGGG